MIRFEDVTAKRSDTKGIYNVSFHVKKGQFVYLMGPTGAGKSTIIKVIQKSINIESGSVYINGNNILDIKQNSLAYYRRDIGMIFQDFKLLNDRSVFENIAIPLQIIGCDQKIIENKISAILSKVGLLDKKYVYPNELSGGEQQKVCVARAIIKSPKIILADEPTGNLDPSASDDIINLLEDEAKKGTTIIMATHNYPLIEDRIKHFIEINNGRLIK
jgi:cell division transport system ATP-binding protein